MKNILLLSVLCTSCITVNVPPHKCECDYKPGISLTDQNYILIDSTIHLVK